MMTCTPGICERPSIRERPRARKRPRPLERPRARAAPSDPLGFFRGLALALPISLALWAGILGAAWELWPG